LIGCVGVLNQFSYLIDKWDISDKELSTMTYPIKLNLL